MTTRLKSVLAVAVLGVVGIAVTIVVLELPAAARADGYRCWNAEYSGGFSWSHQGHYGYGRHTAHQPGDSCTAVYHAPDCDCAWCRGLDGELRDSTPAHWCGHGSCGAGWCTDVDWPAADGEPWWFAHGADCNCGWCAAYSADARGAKLATVPQHTPGCACGWCAGRWDTEPAAADSAYRHAGGCGCGWCAPAAETDTTDTGKATQRGRGHGCCCGCC